MFQLAIELANNGCFTKRGIARFSFMKNINKNQKVTVMQPEKIRHFHLMVINQKMSKIHLHLGRLQVVSGLNRIPITKSV